MNGKNSSQRYILQPIFTQSYFSVPNPTISIHISRTAGTFVLFLHPQSIYNSRTFIFALKFTYPIIKSWEIKNSIPETIRRSACFWVLHTFMLKCVLKYFETFCLKNSENFNSFQFIHTISYTSLHSNITNLLLTYHIRVSSIELYVHLITFSISGQCFISRNQLLHCSCNIGTDAHLLFTKGPSSEFQEFFGKVLYPLDFLQVHMVVMLIWNEWFGWLHTIWTCNRTTSLLLFHDCIFPHTSPTIWLICLFHLCCLDFYLFFQSNDFLPPLHVEYCWDIVRNKCYQDLHLVTCRVNYWRRFSSTKSNLSLLLTRKRLHIVT